MFLLGALGIGLSGVFGGFVLLLVAELYYLLCWKRKSIVNPTVNSTGHGSLFLNGDRIADQSRDVSVSPRGNQIPAANFHAELVTKLFPLGVNGDMSVMQLNQLLGPPRLLFTIKEETKEDLDSEDAKSKDRSRSTECIIFISSEYATPEETPFATPPSSPPFSPPRSPISSPSLIPTLPLPNPSIRASSQPPQCSRHHHLDPMRACASTATVAQRPPSPPWDYSLHASLHSPSKIRPFIFYS
ncbi:hypothetical protein O6H91_10G055000 [Diphasiastrum complanatum]|uniref:Uncharacterized protein n=1 Tax=Diphasiastrum complanatum TaxID=34168 RepID=A0ACC2CHI3_DIPCM|nr:hypothetical protein O6H91_Y009400 [Diphasiastrum complanatum]KAJ7541329.1 hypothetical protein O6H91_10G055000 [Diphasiastrum complanatum]